MRIFIIILFCTILIGCKKDASQVISLPEDNNKVTWISHSETYKSDENGNRLLNNKNEIKWIALLSPCGNSPGKYMSKTPFNTQKECLNHDYSDKCENYESAICMKAAFRRFR